MPRGSYSGPGRRRNRLSRSGMGLPESKYQPSVGSEALSSLTEEEIAMLQMAEAVSAVRPFSALEEAGTEADEMSKLDQALAVNRRDRNLAASAGGAAVPADRMRWRDPSNASVDRKSAWSDPESESSAFTDLEKLLGLNTESRSATAVPEESSDVSVSWSTEKADADDEGEMVDAALEVADPAPRPAPQKTPGPDDVAIDENREESPSWWPNELKEIWAMVPLQVRELLGTIS